APGTGRKTQGLQRLKFPVVESRPDRLGQAQSLLSHYSRGLNPCLRNSSGSSGIDNSPQPAERARRRLPELAVVLPVIEGLVGAAHRDAPREPRARPPMLGLEEVRCQEGGAASG